MSTTKGRSAVVVIVLLGASLASTAPGGGAGGRIAGFVDVPASHPFVEEIEWLVDEGIAAGYPDGTFQPALPVTRGAMAAFLWRLAHPDVGAAPACSTEPFPDTSMLNQFCGEIAWLVAAGIASGFDDGTFRAESPVSRQAMAAFLRRASGDPSPSTPTVAPFSDVPTWHPFAPDIDWLAATGIAGGFADGSFQPTTAVSRQAMAAFLLRLTRHRWTATTTLVSVAPDGSVGNLSSDWGVISADGRYVAFSSGATDLVAGDTNGDQDIFLWERATATTVRISIASDGTEADGPSSRPAISNDGRYVAYESGATNLVAGDTNGQDDIFLWDRATSSTTRVSVGVGGVQAGGRSRSATISGDGRLIAYRSDAANLVPIDANFRTNDIFLLDRAAGTTSLLSLAPDGSAADAASDSPDLSADGRYVAYRSDASNLVPGDSNGTYDVFVADLEAGTTKRESVASDGTQGNDRSFWPHLSADGSYLAFTSEASNLVASDNNGLEDGFLVDRRTGLVRLVTASPTGASGNGQSYATAISADGRFVAFYGGSTNLVVPDVNGLWDAFVWDRVTGTTKLASVSSAGEQGDDHSGPVSISGNGRYVVYHSFATNLVADDTNGRPDVFLWDLGP